MRPLELDGQVFGSLRVVAREGSGGPQGVSWRVKCDCGNEAVKLGKVLRRGATQSCSTGCPVFRAKLGARSKKHGMRGHPAYSTWKNMRQRCRSITKPRYKRYGGRGICVCERWNDFNKFWEDMGASYRPGLQLERKDNDGNYCPENCVWATRKEQQRNKRNNRIIDTPQGRMLLAEASERSGLCVGTLYRRLELCWPAERLFDPVKR